MTVETVTTTRVNVLDVLDTRDNSTIQIIINVDFYYGLVFVCIGLWVDVLNGLVSGV